MPRKQKSLKTVEGYSAFETGIWIKFQKKYPNHAKSIIRLKGEPYPMTIVAWGFGPVSLLEAGDDTNLVKALIPKIKSEKCRPAACKRVTRRSGVGKKNLA
jgi:hypothetical protein